MVSESMEATPAPSTLVIEPSQGWVPLRLDELWRYRELLFFLAWKEIRVRYAQTAVGALWAIFQPLTTVFVFTVFFGKMAKISSEGAPYAVFSMAGLLPWSFFVAGLGRASGGLLSAQGLITKVYFPRLVIPLSAVLAAVPDMLLSLVITVALMVFYGVGFGPGLLALPVLLLLSALSALGFGLWISALTVRYRDLHFVITFLLQLWLYVTPVIYPASYVTRKLQQFGLPGWLYGLNPMAGVVTATRSALLGSAASAGELLAVGSATTAVVLVSGAFYFRRTEREFADLI